MELSFRSKPVDIDSYSLESHAWKRFKRNKPAMVSMYFIILSIIISILGYLVTPDSSPNANNQVLELSVKSPGFKTQMLLIKENQDIKHVSLMERMFFGQPNFYRYVPIARYGFQGPNLVYEGYTGNNPNNGPIIKYNLADVIYALDYSKHLTIDSVNNTITCYIFDQSAPITRTYKDLAEEI